MVYSDAGEDLIASCPKCGYAANLEKAASQLSPVQELEAAGDRSPELVHTPGQRTIEEVGNFLKVAPVHQIKTMAYMEVRTSPGAADVLLPVAVFLRGDHSLNEAKLASLFQGAKEIRPMQLEEIERVFGAPAGYLGPVGLNGLVRQAGNSESREPGKVTVVLDRALEGRANLIAGANKEEYHLRNVTPVRDFRPTLVADVRNVQEGEPCPNCGTPLKLGTAVEVGHIFKLGYRYSETMGARVLDPNGKEVMPIMGCYGIGMERILTAAIEQNHDSNGFWMPLSISPFDVVVTVTNMADHFLAATAEQVARNLENAGFDVLLDDRNERAGVKFKDADLVGIPYRVNVGKKAAEGRLELVTRSTATSEDVEITRVVEMLEEVTRGHPGASQN
jgi:prolyl-tRNA synthetase